MLALRWKTFLRVVAGLDLGKRSYFAAP